jgi:hypothetical protein
MKTLLLAYMASEFLTEFDSNVGTVKCRDEAMPQAVEAPCEHVAFRAAFFGFCVASAPFLLSRHIATLRSFS